MPLIKHILQDVALALLIILIVAGLVWLRVAGLNLMCEWHWLVWCRP